MKIYVASSWRNTLQPAIVQRLREADHEVYDFKEPAPGVKGFGWSEVDPAWKTWTVNEFERGLHHPIASAGFKRDEDALYTADACVLVLPCGRSAHLEAGYAVGQSKPLLIFIPADSALEPELMYSWAHWIGSDVEELVGALDRIREHFIYLSGLGVGQEFKAIWQRAEDEARPAPCTEVPFL